MASVASEVLHEFTFNGVNCSLSTGKVARRSNSAVVGRMGDTVVLVTVDVGQPIEGADFFPLQVEYIERMYAGGIISSSRFIKREGFPSQGATLAARMLDRSIRSRFPNDYRNEVMVVLTVLSYDAKNDPVIIGFSAISAALMASSVPFKGPIAGVRVGYDGEKVYNAPEDVEVKGYENGTKMNFVLGTDGEVVTMIDADGQEVPEDIIVEGMKLGVEASKEFVDAQTEFLKKIEKAGGHLVKDEYKSFAVPQDLLGEVRKLKPEVEKALGFDTLTEKHAELSLLEERLYTDYEGKYSKADLKAGLDYVVKELVREWVLKEKKRTDDRAFDEVRKIEIEVDVLPRAHGSALFTRGGTQALSAATLGSGRQEQLIEGMEGEGTRRYMHHYNAPDFSVGQVGRYRYMPKRREIGHGALAEKALAVVMPSQDDFPYTVRVVSDIMSMEGSSSMASVCGSTLALMDAGVPITKPVAGIAMGVVTSDDLKEYEVLTDISEFEDPYGDMDFKVAGTADGITAIQMDNKRSGLPVEIFEKALEAAKKARLHILGQMNDVISTPREDLSEFAPKIEIVRIPPERIGELIGPGGKIIKGIIEKTGADIDVTDDGRVSISSVDAESRNTAKEIVEGMFVLPEVGKVYRGKVGKVAEYGAFVDVSPSISGLVHISEMSDSFVKDPGTLVKEGQEVDVILLDIDDRGRLRFSMKRVPKEGQPEAKSDKKDDVKTESTDAPEEE